MRRIMYINQRCSESFYINTSCKFTWRFSQNRATIMKTTSISPLRKDIPPVIGGRVGIIQIYFQNGLYWITHANVVIVMEITALFCMLAPYPNNISHRDGRPLRLDPFPRRTSFNLLPSPTLRSGALIN